MKKLLLLSMICCTMQVSAQITLFQDDFESGTSQWTLNTGTGANSWVVNNIYLGFSGLVPDTPNQPGSIASGPQSNYMHITNSTLCTGLSVCNANFDTGSASNQNTEIATSVDASNYTDITVSFWYLCAGQTNVSYGTMEYSLDGGATWVAIGTNYQNTTTWTQESVTLPAWDNASAFKVRFKWQNGGGGLDPAFSVDDILIEGTAVSATNTITTTNDVSPASWCFNSMQTGIVNFNSTGTYTAGNVYTAELSDASGSFASPTNIGTLNSTANGALSITTAIPTGVIAGTGYRVRVVSSAPATIGTDNTADLIVNDLPSVAMTPLTQVCVYNNPTTLSEGSPAGGVYSGPGVSAGMFDPSVAGIGGHTITYTITDGNGCSNGASASISVDGCASIEELDLNHGYVVPNPIINQFTIEGINQLNKVELLDLSGKTILTFNTSINDFSLEGVSRGAYLLKISSDNNTTIIRVIKD